MHLTIVVLPVAIVALGFLIIVHEGGHYFVARWCKMRIERFSIGFGPGLLKKTSKKTGTTFQLAPIPFGGFVEIRGMNIAEDVDPEDANAYPNRPVWQRFLTIFAGPATNYLAAIVLAFGVYTCHGIEVKHSYAVVSLEDDSDAHGKLEPGDHIVAVDHVSLASGRNLTERVNDSKGTALTLTVERDGETRDFQVTPKLAKTEKPDDKPVWRIGVRYRPYPVSVGVIGAAEQALIYPVEQTQQIGTLLYGVVFGHEKADPGGPIRMVEEFYYAFSDGIVPGLKLVMALSVYLGLFNLLPIPALDGGRLVFLVYEMVARRRANPKIEAMVHMAGIMALGLVMMVVLYIDIRRFWT